MLLGPGAADGVVVPVALGDERARRVTEARKLAEDLKRAMDSRAVIDQARGVLMARLGISAEQALDELSRQSQNTNVKLRVVAARLLESVRRQDL